MRKVDCRRAIGQLACLTDGAEEISGERMAEAVLKSNAAGYGCVAACKRVVEIDSGPWEVDPRYGGPEYQTLAAMAAYCGVSNLPAICRANQLCKTYGVDMISCAATIAWARWTALSED